jgi:hypothetical protein
MGSNLNLFFSSGTIMFPKEKELKLPWRTNVFEFFIFFIITFAYEF